MDDFVTPDAIASLGEFTADFGANSAADFNANFPNSGSDNTHNQEDDKPNASAPSAAQSDLDFNVNSNINANVAGQADLGADSEESKAQFGDFDQGFEGGNQNVENSNVPESAEKNQSQGFTDFSDFGAFGDGQQQQSFSEFTDFSKSSNDPATSFAAFNDSDNSNDHSNFADFTSSSTPFESQFNTNFETPAQTSNLPSLDPSLSLVEMAKLRLVRLFPDSKINFFSTENNGNSIIELILSSRIWKFYKDSEKSQLLTPLLWRESLLKKIFKSEKPKGMAEIEQETTTEEFNQSLHDLLFTMSFQELENALEDVSTRIQSISDELMKQLEIREQLTSESAELNDSVSFLMDQRKNGKATIKPQKISKNS